MLKAPIQVQKSQVLSGIFYFKHTTSDSCPYKNTNRQMQDEQHDSIYCPDHLFSPVLLLPVSSSSICLHTSPACFSLARMIGRASLSV